VVHALDQMLKTTFGEQAEFTKIVDEYDWSYLDVHEGRYGMTSLLFNTDEEGTFLHLQLTHHEAVQVRFAEMYAVLNLMNAVQYHLQFFVSPTSGNVHGRRHVDLKGRSSDEIAEHVLSGCTELHELIEDVIWLFDYKCKIGGDQQELLTALRLRVAERSKARLNGKENEAHDPAFG
jgi:hypothetical protein